MKSFSPTWFLLQQEGLLAQACLCNGLTALRHANLGAAKGRFYSAFFELSIGFERTLKLILILDRITLIAALREVNNSLCGSAWKTSSAGRTGIGQSGVTDVPNMEEFFLFACVEKKQDVMKKRRWP